MIINYFDKYYIDTYKLNDKFNLISSHDSENATFINMTYKKALEYLFKPVDFNIPYLIDGFPNDIDNNTTIVYFDNYFNDENLNNILSDLSNNVSKTILIGNHKTKVINNKIFCININNFKEIKKHLSSQDNLFLGFNLDCTNWYKYYYGRMRVYYLNTLNQFNSIDINELENDVEEVCTKILLNEQNFDFIHSFDMNNIKLKRMFKTYKKILKLKNLYKNKLFFTYEGVLTEEKKYVLNDISEILMLLNTKNNEEILSYVYDNISNQLLEEAKQLNYCNFVENKCVSIRYTDNSFPNSDENGCCKNTYKDKRKNCRYLNENYSCSICSISCRAFTCGYLQKRGIDHSLWQYPLIDCLIKRLYVHKIVFNFFIPKEEMMKKLKRSIV